MNMTLQDVGILFAVVASILGWIYQLGYSSARLQRNEQDIAELKRKQDERIGALEEKIGAGLQRIYDKLDRLPCKNAGWKQEDC